MKKESAKKETGDWMQKKWRPMMAIMYMIVCVFDFIVFPIMFTIVQFWETQAANDAFRQWVPITLGGGGLFHVAMGAVLGVSAWSRGQEKIAGAAINQGTQSNGYNLPTSGPSTFGSQATGGFGSNNYPTSTPVSYPTTNYGNGQQSYSGYETTREFISAEPVTGYKGKKAPMQPPDPVI